LAQEAKGDYFLFLDADVRLASEALACALAEMEAKNLDLLSLFPEQQMETWGEKIVVPLMHELLLSLLPLRWVLGKKNPAFSAANGQFMLFHAEAYRQGQYHSALRIAVTEDICIAERMKSEGRRVETLLGNGLVFCRMYRSAWEAIEGFSKNIFAGFRYSLPFILVYFLLTDAAFLIVLVGGTPLMQIILLFLVVFIRAGLAALGKRPIFLSLTLHPLHKLALLYTAANSVWRHYRRKNVWKGRALPV
jgi:chlorobactene glucosyltransferase